MQTRTLARWSFLIGLWTTSAYAQTPASAPITVGGDVTLTGSLRTRSYSWDWFGDNGNGSYTYPASLIRLGLMASKRAYEWQVEFAAPVLLNLPTSAVMGAPQGQLGLGASYFAANSNSTNAGYVFLKQGFVRFKGIGGIAGQSLKVGRMEFNDGAEVVPAHATLASLKRDRISQRLLGNFGFSDVGRSLDGALYSITRGKLNLTALAARPTQGVFDVSGWPELNINVFYGALTGQVGGEHHAGEWRVFVLAYDDYRHGVLKTDNRSAAARAADTGSIALGTYGGHYLQVASTRAGPVDLLFWGAGQTGSWGALAQRARAFAAEVGWQPTGLEALKPWIRAGYEYGSGDGNPADQTHGTFFQVMPTPRVYARLPFFNMMNNRDAFGALVLRPSKRLTVRTELHALALANAADLWYSGGGPFQPATFGYTGRPSSSQSSLATLSDISGDYNVNPNVAVGAYYGYASSNAVTSVVYSSGAGARLGYFELLLRF